MLNFTSQPLIFNSKFSFRECNGLLTVWSLVILFADSWRMENISAMPLLHPASQDPHWHQWQATAPAALAWAHRTWEWGQGTYMLCHYSFQRRLDTPIILWQYDWIRRESYLPTNCRSTTGVYIKKTVNTGSGYSPYQQVSRISEPFTGLHPTAWK